MTPQISSRPQQLKLPQLPVFGLRQFRISLGRNLNPLVYQAG
jgi:hypothetical protein